MKQYETPLFERMDVHADEAFAALRPVMSEIILEDEFVE